MIPFYLCIFVSIFSVLIITITTSVKDLSYSKKHSVYRYEDSAIIEENTDIEQLYQMSCFLAKEKHSVISFADKFLDDCPTKINKDKNIINNEDLSNLSNVTFVDFNQDALVPETDDIYNNTGSWEDEYRQMLEMENLNQENVIS